MINMMSYTKPIDTDDPLGAVFRFMKERCLYSRKVAIVDPDAKDVAKYEASDLPTEEDFRRAAQNRMADAEACFDKRHKHRVNLTAIPGTLMIAVYDWDDRAARDELSKRICQPTPTP